MERRERGRGMGQSYHRAGCGVPPNGKRGRDGYRSSEIHRGGAEDAENWLLRDVVRRFPSGGAFWLGLKILGLCGVGVPHSGQVPEVLAVRL